MADIILPPELLHHLTNKELHESNIVFSNINTDTDSLLQNNIMFRAMAAYPFKDILNKKNETISFAENYLFDLLELDKQDFNTFIRDEFKEEKRPPETMNRYANSFTDPKWKTIKKDFIKKIERESLLSLINALEGTDSQVLNKIDKQLILTLEHLRENGKMVNLKTLEDTRDRTKIASTSWKRLDKDTTDKVDFEYENKKYALISSADRQIGLEEKPKAKKKEDKKRQSKEMYLFSAKMQDKKPLLFDSIMDNIKIKQYSSPEGSNPKLVLEDSNRVQVTFDGTKYINDLLFRFGYGEGLLTENKYKEIYTPFNIQSYTKKIVNEKEIKNPTSKEGLKANIATKSPAKSRPLVYFQLLYEGSSKNWTHVNFVSFNKTQKIQRENLDELINEINRITESTSRVKIIKDELEKTLMEYQESTFAFSNMILQQITPAMSGIFVGKSEFVLHIVDYIDDAEQLESYLDDLENPLQGGKELPKGEELVEITAIRNTIDKKKTKVKKFIKQYKSMKDITLNKTDKETHIYNLEKPQISRKMMSNSLVPTWEELMNSVKNKPTETKDFYTKEFIKELNDVILSAKYDKELDKNEFSIELRYPKDSEGKEDKSKTKKPTFVYKYPASYNYKISPIDIFTSIINQKDSDAIKENYDKQMEMLENIKENTRKYRTFNREISNFMNSLRKTFKAQRRLVEEGTEGLEEYRAKTRYTGGSLLYDGKEKKERKNLGDEELIKPAQQNEFSRFMITLMDSRTPITNVYGILDVDKEELDQIATEVLSSQKNTYIFPIIEEVRDAFTGSHMLSSVTSGTQYEGRKYIGADKKPDIKRSRVSTKLFDNNPKIKKLIQSMYDNFKYIKDRSV